LLTRRVEGTKRPCRLDKKGIKAVEQWLDVLHKADGRGTLMTMRMALPDERARTRMLATGMEHGMEDSYARLERLL
jgi:hypothetical protein